MPLNLASPAELTQHVGQTFGPTNWTEVSQKRIQAFADATDDWQWIHLDAERTTTELGHPPVAHGYLTLSLLAPAMYELVQIEYTGRIINYGVNKVRFITPVFAGDKIRATATIARATREDGFTRTVFDVVVSSNRVEKPAMTAQLIILYFDAEGEEK